MSIFLYLIAGVLFWLGFDAFQLSRHESPLNQVEKDEMMFGKNHRRPIPDSLRSFVEMRYPLASGASTWAYGVFFILGGGVVAFLAWYLEA
uniref:Uncharacterized protein n=1 Tax=Curvibacter symbiont subsp. Hydra magnipapillata TaxID=667019 RepID=C9YE24_CURXX|nr:hypothetical protein Csp_D28300 [Curvibacter putative symbiont of Hydra magnipapillata]